MGAVSMLKYVGNNPLMLYNLGKFKLLLGLSYRSFETYALAVNQNPSFSITETALHSLQRLESFNSFLPAFPWIYRLLLIADVVRQKNETPDKPGTAIKAKNKITDNHRHKTAAGKAEDTAVRIKELASHLKKPVRAPVVLMAGGCDHSAEQQMVEYRRIILAAFRHYEGTVIGGGTEEGVSGLVGELGKEYPNKIHTIGYIPQQIPFDAHIDERYHDLYETAGRDFSPLEPLQAWIDILASGLGSADVRLLGFNGGKIAAAEYMTATAFGSPVRLIKNSGREADRLLRNKLWSNSYNLKSLPLDVMAIKAFIGL